MQDFVEENQSRESTEDQIEEATPDKENNTELEKVES